VGRRRDSSVGIATGCTAGVQFLALSSFSLFHCIEAGSGVHSVSYPMCTGADFPKSKRQRREADYHSPSSAEVKNGGAIPPLLHLSSRLSD
jgi:hypothetical protein